MPTSDSAEPGPYIEFGRWIRDQRIAAGLSSQPQAEIRARGKGLHLINQGKLSHIERGENSNPDPDLLKQLATLYRLKYVDVVGRWMQVRYAVSSDAMSVPTDQAGTTESTLPNGGGARDTATRERLQYLEGRLLFYEELIEHAKADAARTLATLSPEGGESPQPESGHRGRTRKVR